MKYIIKKSYEKNIFLLKKTFLAQVVMLILKNHYKDWELDRRANCGVEVLLSILCRIWTKSRRYIYRPSALE